MSQAQPDYSIILAILGILLAIGIPSLKRGEWIVGGICISLAVVVVIGWIIATRSWRR